MAQKPSSETEALRQTPELGHKPKGLWAQATDGELFYYKFKIYVK